MRQLQSALVGVAILGGAWYGVRHFLPFGVSQDFDVICSAYESGMRKIHQVEINSRHPNEPEIAVEIATAIERAVVNRNVSNSVRAVAMASADQKYRLLQTAAAELGIKDWECEAALRYFEREAKLSSLSQ